MLVISGVRIKEVANLKESDNDVVVFALLLPPESNYTNCTVTIGMLSATEMTHCPDLQQQQHR